MELQTESFSKMMKREQMNFFKSSKNLPPHKIDSKLLHWREGDEIIARNLKITGLVSLLIALENDGLKKTLLF